MSTIVRVCVGWGVVAALSAPLSAQGQATAQNSPQAQATLHILTPTPGTVVNPGQTIVVYVSTSTEPLKGVGLMAPDLQITSAAFLEAPPYQFSLTIPPGIRPGLHAIAAIGIPSSPPPKSANPGDFFRGSERVSIDVERRDSPQSIGTDTQCLEPANKRPRRLNCIEYTRELEIGGETNLNIYGAYSDGSIIDLTKSTQTTFASQSPGIATVTSEGRITGIGPGSTHIIVDGRLSIPVTVDPYIRISPTQVTLKASQTLEFVARLTHPPNGAVTWTLNPPVGSLVNSVYKAPDSLASAQTVYLTAASAADPALFATAVITLSPAVSVDVVPAYAVLYMSQPQQFKANMANAGTLGVKWSISPSGAGAINSAGLYTAPSSISALQNVKIIATSATNPAISGSTTIYISPRPFVMLIQPSALRLPPGASNGTSVTLLASDGFWHPIALSAVGLPSGVTASFSKPTLQGNNQTTLTFTASAAAAPGSYQVTVVAKDTVYPVLTHSVIFNLNIGAGSN